MEPIVPETIEFDADFDLMILDHVDASKSLIRATQRSHYEWNASDGGKDWGYQNLIPHDELLEKSNNFTKNGQINFVVVIRMRKALVQDINDGTLLTEYNALFSEMTLHNRETVHLSCSDGKSISALKKIICSKSEVFQKMFDIDMTEKSQGSVNIIDFDSEVMSELVYFVYFGNVRESILENIDIQLYQAAEVNMIEGLKEICVKSINNRLSIQNVPEIIEFANVHEEKELYKSCFHLICM